MKVHVLFGQRICQYPGEYGVEALACMSEYEHSDNPDYLNEQLEQHRSSKEFEALAVIDLEVSEAEILKVLYPSGIVDAKVLGSQTV